MADKKRNEELQSRRDFFKKAAKGVLPILGAVVLAGVPNLVKAEETPMGCRYGCAGACVYNCSGSCSGRCLYGCDTNCRGTCSTNCVQSCKGYCKGACATNCWAACASSSYN